MIEIALFISGVIAGFINAVAGGGILFVFPVLLAAGLSPLAAAMTSTFAGWPGALSSIFGYRKDLRKVKKQYFWLVLPCIIGAAAGSLLLTNTPSNMFERIVPWLILFSVLLFAFQPQLHKHIHRPAHMRKASPFLLLALLLLPVSIYGGYYGAGFGFIVLALLGFTKLKNVCQINGMKNVVTAGISITCSLIFAASGGIVWEYALAPMLGSIVGGLLGSHLAHHVSPHASRTAVISTGFAVVIVLFGNIF